MSRMRTVQGARRGGGGSSEPGEVAWGPDFGEGHNQVTLTPANLVASGVTTDKTPSKDAFYQDIAVCTDSADHGNQNLEINGVAATKRNIIIGWDLSSLPSGITVASASLTVNVVSAMTTAGDITLNHIANAEETWVESGAGHIECANKPALTALAPDWNAPFGTTGEKTVSLPGAALTRIGARAGVGVYSLVLTAGGLATNAELRQRGAATGPRLTFAWSKTLEA